MLVAVADAVAVDEEDDVAVDAAEEVGTELIDADVDGAADSVAGGLGVGAADSL